MLTPCINSKRSDNSLRKSIVSSAVVPLLVVLLSLLSACGGGGGGSPDAGSPCEDGSDPRTLCELQLSPVNPAVAVGTTVQLQATAIYSDQTKEDVTEAAVWGSSDDLTATVADSTGDKGEVQGIAQGLVVVSAGFGGKQRAVQIAVNQAQLVSIELSKLDVELPNGTQTTISAIGHYTGNLSYDISDVATWSLVDTGIATVSVDTVVTLDSVAPGTTLLTASFGDISASTNVSVTNAVLNSLGIEPGQLSTALGTEAVLKAIGLYSDGNIRDLTDQVNWSSSDDSIVTPGQIAGTEGVLTTNKTGSVTISAVKGGITSSAAVTVTDAILTEITITPTLNNLAKGTRAQFSATGRYSDFTTRDVTPEVTWASSSTLTAIVDNTQEKAGLLTAVQVGDVDVTATMNGVSATHSLTISSAILIGLNITPLNPSVAAGSRVAFNAIANFSDGSEQDVTDIAGWSAGDTAIATSLQDSDNTGGFQTLTAGTVTIVATYLGKSESTELVVTAATLDSISIDSADLTLAAGTTSRLTVTGNYSDASTADISDLIVWESSQPDIVSVINTGTNIGTVNALSIGDSILTASVAGDPLTFITVNVSVTNAILQSITVSADKSEIFDNDRATFLATGEFSDGTTQDLTELVAWSSSATELAVVSNVSGEKGQVFGVANAVTGSDISVITASIEEDAQLIEGVAELTVTYAPQRPVGLTLQASPNVIVNDGLDSAIIDIYLKASEAGAVVADGTLVNLEIVNGTGVLDSSSVATVNGVAQAALASTFDGFVLLRASIPDSSVSNYIVIASTPSFSDIFITNNYATYVYDETANTVQGNSEFFLYLLNLSNRDFALDKYEFINGTTVLKTIDQFDVINNEILGGSYYGLRLNIEPQLVNNGLTGRYTLSDPITGQVFTVSHTWVLVP